MLDAEQWEEPALKLKSLSSTNPLLLPLSIAEITASFIYTKIGYTIFIPRSKHK
jgi:hypothetical protein